MFQNYNALLNIKNSPDNLTNEHIHFVKDRLGHDFRYAINSSEDKKEPNWRPKSLANGLKKQFVVFKQSESIINFLGE